MTFKYTEKKTDFDSSVVEGAYYDADTRKLWVVLDSGYGYQYDNFPVLRWHAFKTAPSAGNYYSTQIKPVYGPASEARYVAVGMGDFFVNAATIESNGITVTGDGHGRLGALGTPKGLTYSDGATVTYNITQNAVNPTEVAEAVRVTLGTNDRIVSVVPESHKHTVRFTVPGSQVEGLREYSLEATDVNSAVEQVTNIADSLGLDFEVKEVTVYFE